MDRIARSKLNVQIHEEASEWFIEHRSGDLDEAGRREFDRWLRQSPEHLRTYLEIAAIWNEGASMDLERKWDIDTLVEQATQAHANVIPLTSLAQQADARPASPKRGDRKWRLVGIAASIALCIAVGFVAWERMIAAPTYATAVGEQRSIMLPDGSTVELNSRSRIKVRYSEHERAVELLEGQALFQVAKNQARPFIVTSGETRVRAVGTQFDVYKKREGTIVTVLEGRVAILTDADVRSFGAATVDVVPSPSLSIQAPPQQHAPDDVPEAKVFLSSGEQLTVTPTAIQKATHPNVASATAWTQRQLVFDSASLTEVAEEFNRYNERRLVIQDAQLYDFHISGVFSSSDPTSLIRFLRERPGVRVTESDSEIRVEKLLRENSQPTVTDS